MPRRSRAATKPSAPTSPPSPAEADVSGMADLAGLLVTANRIGERLQRLASLAEVSVADWLLMRSLDGAEPLTKAAVARKIGVSRQRAHQQVNQLQRRGLINPSSEADRALALSPEGEAAIRLIEDEVAAALAVDGAVRAEDLKAARRRTVLVLRSLNAALAAKDAPAA